MTECAIWRNKELLTSYLSFLTRYWTAFNSQLILQYYHFLSLRRSITPRNQSIPVFAISFFASIEYIFNQWSHVRLLLLFSIGFTSIMVMNSHHETPNLLPLWTARFHFLGLWKQSSKVMKLIIRILRMKAARTMFSRMKRSQFVCGRPSTCSHLWINDFRLSVREYLHPSRRTKSTIWSFRSEHRFRCWFYTRCVRLLDIFWRMGWYASEEDSPYAEVRSAVANFDDPDMPASTIRAWVSLIYSTHLWWPSQSRLLELGNHLDYHSSWHQPNHCIPVPFYTYI